MMIKLLHIDCMEYMATVPDKYFDLAIVDPPYGIDINKSGRLVREKGWGYKCWDKMIPTSDYFKELNRISQNQIIWGGNYFNLPPTRCFIIWDKQQPEDVSFAGCEFAWTNFDESAKIFRERPQGNIRIHPTQKPISLYKWLLKRYAKPTDKIIDTHLGSGSSAIAAYDFGCVEFVGCEIDEEYYNAAKKRFEIHTQQQQIIFE